MEKYDVVIVGAGAAGLSAGIYAGRYNMKTVIINKEFGGETSKGGNIENWPGDIEVDGYELMSRMRKHAEKFNAEIVDGTVDKIEKNGDCFDIIVGDTVYHTPSVIVALGAERRRLGLPHEDELTGKGVHFCVTCDGPIYAGRTVALVGGGDAAVKGALLMSEYVEKIYMIVRAKKMRAEPINQEKLKEIGDKIEILYETKVKEIVPNEKGFFGKVILDKEYNGSMDLDVDGLFIDIGAEPNTETLDGLGVKTDEAGYLDVDNMMRTNIHGIFAAGDIMNHFGHFKQDITAAATGAVAATSAYDHHKDHKYDDKCSHN